MYYTHFNGPVGKILIAGDAEGLKWIGFSQGKKAKEAEPHWERNDAFFAEAKRQLADYFAGRLKKFQLKLAPSGTPFQRQVLQALQEIPYGTTTSYGDIARKVGRPNASRAVGAANGRNPLSIVIPCHRVIGANGDLTGFGGGLDTKKALLALEEKNK